MFKKIFITLAIITALVPAVTFAADTFGSGMLDSSAGHLGLQSDLSVGIAAVIKTVLAVTGTIFLVLTIAGGIIWMTASGNDEKVNQAKKIIIAAAIGLAICLFAYTITSFVAWNLSGASEAGVTCTGVCTDGSSCGSLDSAPGSCNAGQVCCG
jgi:hypothetical protein